MLFLASIPLAIGINLWVWLGSGASTGYAVFFMLFSLAILAYNTRLAFRAD